MHEQNAHLVFVARWSVLTDQYFFFIEGCGGNFFFVTFHFLRSYGVFNF